MTLFLSFSLSWVANTQLDHSTTRYALVVSYLEPNCRPGFLARTRNSAEFLLFIPEFSQISDFFASFDHLFPQNGVLPHQTGPGMARTWRRSVPPSRRHPSGCLERGKAARSHHMYQCG